MSTDNVPHSPTPWRFIDCPIRGRCLMSADNKYVMCEGIGVFGAGDEALLIRAVNENAALRALSREARR